MIPKYEIIHKGIDLLDIIMRHRGRVGFLDIETTGLNPRKDRILDIAMTFNGCDTAYIFDPSIAHLTLEHRGTWVFHNAKFDLQFFKFPLWERPWLDTMLMHHLLDENSPHDLDHIVSSRCGDQYKREFWSKYKNYSDAPIEERHLYNAKDIMYTKKVYNWLINALAADGIPQSLINHTHEFAKVLLRTEIQGLNIDLSYLVDKGLDTLSFLEGAKNKALEAFRDQIRVLEDEYTENERGKRSTEKGKAGVKHSVFNFESSKQVKDLLYNTLRLPVQRNEKTREPSSDDASLRALLPYNEAINHIIDMRTYSKIYDGFIESTLSKMENGKIHPSFNINGTVTGRISSSGPNMQQLPSGGGIRGIYISQKDNVFVTADYSQLEVTLAAHYSMDVNLLKVVNEGASLHDLTAKGLGIDRDKAKTINFALQYGAGPGKVMKILNCSKDEAKYALNRYWETYPGLKALIDQCHAMVDTKLPIINPFGRKRRLNITDDMEFGDIAYLKRQAFNALIQGTGADLTNRAFVKVDKELKKEMIGHALFVVHDEIIVETSKETVDLAKSAMVYWMCKVGEEAKLRVPLKVEVSGPMNRWED